jgi:uncharacterized protein (DUF58 family)
VRSVAPAVALGLVLCLLAGALGAWSLYVPGIALVLLWAGAASSVRLAGARTRVSRQPLLASVEEDSPLTLSVAVDGPRVRLAAGELSRWPDAEPVPLARRARGHSEFVVQPRRRGRQTIGPSTLRFGDPFGICERTVSSPPSEVLVLPRVERLDPARLARVLGAERSSRRAATAEIDTLRPYRPGAPASRIHWPTVARTGQLMERSLSPEADRLPLVVLDARRPADEGTLDMAVRAAGSLTLGLARLGGCRLLLPGGQRARALAADLAGWPELHERLALVHAGSTLARGAYEQAGLLLWVTAGLSDEPGPRQRRAGGCFTISPFAREDRPVLLTVAGCALQATRGAAR